MAGVKIKIAGDPSKREAEAARFDDLIRQHYELVTSGKGKPKPKPKQG